MLTERELELLPERIVARINKVNTRFLEIIGNRIKEIGTMTETDAHRIRMQINMEADINEIELALANISGKNLADIQEIFDIVAEDNLKFAEAVSGGVSAAAAASLNTYVNVLKQQAMEDYGNLSHNTAFMKFDKRGRKVSTDLHRFYSEIVDDAIIAVTSGQSDFYSRMRGVLRAAADSGIRTKYSPLKGSAGKTADYATGYSRRLDTAVRQNLLWGIKQCNDGMMDQIGKDFNADGYEVDYHAHPRPSHAWMGGRQFILADTGVTINGVYFPPFSEAEELLEDYNCLHKKFPIICGVSEPNHSPEELRKLKAKDKETIEFEGKEYTGYEFTQLQRKIETAVRHAKDRQIIANAAGDDELRRREQEKINILTHKYKKVCDVSGLPSKKERMSVAGYRKVKTKDELKANNTLKNGGNGGTIKLPNIKLLKGVGASGKNYPIELPGGNHVRFIEGTEITNVTVFAGRGTPNKIKDVKRLVAEYNIPADEWMKVSGNGYIMSDGQKCLVEVHWYQANEDRYEMKVKRYIDES